MSNPIPSAGGDAIGQEALLRTTSGPLSNAIERILKREGLHEDFAEKYVVVHAENGVVQVPGTSDLIATESESVCFRGTDDHVFKDFTEKDLRKLYFDLTKGDAAPWAPSHDRNLVKRSQLPAHRLTKQGQAILHACKGYDPRWAVAYTHHVFHPTTTLMLRAMQRYATKLSQITRDGTTVTIDPEVPRLLDRISRFVRRVAGKWKFINALNEHEARAQSNFESAREFIYHCAGRSSKLLIIRIDLYRQPYHDVAGGDADIDKFTRWLRSKKCKKDLLPGYLGFIIKAENGLVRGMHWHLLVVADGNRHCSTDYLTRQLGEKWARLSGQGRGCYHNCYEDRARYPANGLGVLELDDWEKMLGLRLALHYMTKQDCILSVSNDATKHFWRSTIRARDGKKSGRPRASEDSLALLKRMLGGKRSKVPPGMEGHRYRQRAWIR